MATPISCTLYTATALFIPWNGRLANQTSEQFFGLESGPSGAPCPGQVRPFDPRLVAGTSNPAAGAFSDFHLKLDRDDGDQFLGRPQLQAAARVHRRPGRDRLLLGGGDRRRGAAISAAASRRVPAARPRARSGRPTSPPAPAHTRSTRSAGCTWPGRSRARPCPWPR